MILGTSSLYSKPSTVVNYCPPQQACGRRLSCLVGSGLADVVESKRLKSVP